MMYVYSDKMQQPQPQLSFRMEGTAADSMFRPGYQFEPMTYDALCETVAFESCRQGGPCRNLRFSFFGYSEPIFPNESGFLGRS